MDLGEVFSSALSGTKEKKTAGTKDKITLNDDISTKKTSGKTLTKENNLKKFKSYLENDDNVIKENALSIQYDYKTNMQIFSKEDGSIISENIEEIPLPSDNTSAKIINRGKKDIWVDKNMSEFIDNLWEEYKDEFNTKIGYCNFDFIVNHNENGTRILDCRTQECNLGNLVADAIRESTNSDITLLNGGAVKNNMVKGNLT